MRKPKTRAERQACGEPKTLEAEKSETSETED